jgi:5'-deoxynucleotidase
VAITWPLGRMRRSIMAEFTLAERLRTAHVTRWQIVRTLRQQTVAEHLYLVRVISLAFAEAAGFTHPDTLLAEQWALEHDVPEVKTGDLATPIKAAMREAVPHDDPIRRIELAMSDSYRDLYTVVKDKRPHVRDLVKMADLVEAVAFLELEGVGPHAMSVQHGLWQAFIDLVEHAKERHAVFNWQAVYNVARTHTGG